MRADGPDADRMGYKDGYPSCIEALTKTSCRVGTWSSNHRVQRSVKVHPATIASALARHPSPPPVSWRWGLFAQSIDDFMDKTKTTGLMILKDGQVVAERYQYDRRPGMPMRPQANLKTWSIEALRAIPWGFSWGQCRVSLPAWAGFGSAVKAYLAQGPADQQLKTLQAMNREWPFFQTLISNMDMVLAKSDQILASAYAELVEDRALARRIERLIRLEWDQAHQALNMILSTEERLSAEPALKQSIEYRFPYLDPLSYLQVELLRRYRGAATKSNKEALRIQTAI